MGGKVSGPFWARSPSLAIIEDTPWIAYAESINGVYNVFVRRWTGTTWELVGDSLNQSAYSMARAPVDCRCRFGPLRRVP